MEHEKLPAEVEMPKAWHKIANKTLWLISTARNAILVIVGGFIGYAVYKDGETPPFKLIGDVPKGLPTVQLPPFSYESGNGTVTFGDMLSNLGTSIVVVPLIALLENIAICKAFGKSKI